MPRAPRGRYVWDHRYGLVIDKRTGEVVGVIFEDEREEHTE